MIVRSSRRGNLDTKYKRARSGQPSLRISRCRRVLANVPKYSSKTGVNKGRSKISRVRLSNLVIDLLSRREVSARQDAMTYLVRVRELLVDGES